jgi:hypothetical protein
MSNLKTNLSTQIGGISISDLTEMLKSESVYKLLRHGIKRPEISGVDNCEDSYYYDLYLLICELRETKTGEPGNIN